MNDCLHSTTYWYCVHINTAEPTYLEFFSMVMPITDCVPPALTNDNRTYDGLTVER